MSQQVESCQKTQIPNTPNSLTHEQEADILARIIVLKKIHSILIVQSQR